MSSYNNQTFDIINSSASSTFAFVETRIQHTKKSNLIYKIDIKKSRKNAMYYSKFNYPLFTVMDQVQPFKPNMSYTKPGLYHIKTELYFPTRGNGWYSHAMIIYLIENKLITTENIEYVIYSSLVVFHDHFNSFIDEIYNIKDGYEKLKINCMIGSLKPGNRENFKTVAIGSDPNVMYHHFLEANAAFIDKFDIDDTTYYHALEKFTMQSEESETPIYNMTLELEIINLHSLCKEIERLGGSVLDVNTDCAICTFKNNEFPFTVDSNGDVEGYYFDNEMKVPK